jgi:hypothetical protein
MTDIERRLLANQELILDTLIRLLMRTLTNSSEQQHIGRLAKAAGKTRALLELDTLTGGKVAGPQP